MGRGTPVLSFSRPRQLLLLTAILSTSLAAVHCGGSDPQPPATGTLGTTADSGAPPQNGDGGASGVDPGGPAVPTRSAGCGKAPPPRGEYTDLGDGRQYLQYPSAGYASGGLGDRGYPVMLVLHGCYADVGVTATSFLNFHEKIGDEAVVIYGVSQNPSGSCGWKVGQPTDIDYLDQVLDRVGEDFCVDPSRVAVLGYSWGAYMAHDYACKRPDRVKAVVGAAGGWPSSAEVATCAPLPTLIYGRTHDNNESIQKSKSARDKRVAINGCGTTPVPAAAPLQSPVDPNVVGCVDYPGCTGGARTTFCEDPKNFADMGHPEWNHTLWEPYHRPIWDWLSSLP